MNRPQQKYVLLLVDEVKIRPTVAFSGGALSGMATNYPESNASSMLCVMMKSLISRTQCHGVGDSSPQHDCGEQFKIVKEAAIVVEEAGATVIGSITDNHKVNQQYCRLFKRPPGSVCPATPKHPLDDSRKWYLLLDTVHLLKCI